MAHLVSGWEKCGRGELFVGLGHGYNVAWGISKAARLLHADFRENLTAHSF